MDKNDELTQAFAKSMQLRDFFAGMVLTGMVAHKGQMTGKFADDMHTAAQYCYRCADMMLRAREEKNIHESQHS